MSFCVEEGKCVLRVSEYVCVYTLRIRKRISYLHWHIFAPRNSMRIVATMSTATLTTSAGVGAAAAAARLSLFRDVCNGNNFR